MMTLGHARCARLIGGALTLVAVVTSCQQPCDALRDEACAADDNGAQCALLSDEERFSLLTSETCASIRTSMKGQ